jgi:hypothetical protein
MRRMLLLAGMMLASLFASVSPAAARSAVCDGVLTGKTISRDVTVPPGAACRIVNSVVRGDVKVRGRAYFQGTHATIRGDVEAKGAQTLFLDGGSLVRGDVVTDRTAQVYVFASTVRGGIDVSRATDSVNICGNTVRNDIHVERSGRDILVGDPLAIDCPGNNVVQRGNIEVENNFTDVEFVVSGNRIDRGNLAVRLNKGPSAKFVQNNTGGRRLVCTGNAAPFAGSGNTGWVTRAGQCATP